MKLLSMSIIALVTLTRPGIAQTTAPTTADLVGTWASKENRSDPTTTYTLILKADSTWTESITGSKDNPKPRRWTLSNDSLQLAGEGVYLVKLQEGGQELVLRRRNNATGKYTYKRVSTP